MRLSTFVCTLTFVSMIAGVTTADAQRTRKRPAKTTAKTPARPNPAPATAPANPAPLASSGTVLDERQLYLSASQTAWAFVNRNYQPSTGLARAHDTYQYVTLWDVASGLAATYCAHEMGLIADAAYNQRMQRSLATLSTADLFDGAAFNKSYDSRTGKMIDRSQRISSKGYGWSVTDIGRLLIWLRIIAVNQPQFATQATSVVKRLNISRLINDGDRQGTDIDPRTGQTRVSLEGRMGYEQYGAAGLALWGFRAEKALDARLNALPVNVLGVSIVGDKRGDERITSEPYIMMGMETGWYSPELREQAWRILAAQEARYRSSGTITMVSEDALPDPPYYFYYYNVYRQGRPFIVDAPAGSGNVDRPRWISSKAAFAWHALLPTPYTLAAVQAVQGAAISRGRWGGGGFGGELRATRDAGVQNGALNLR